MVNEGKAKPRHGFADTLLDNLTVYEQLLYTSELKNSQKESLARKKARVEIVISQLSMESCKNVTIGSAMKRGISGILHRSDSPVMSNRTDLSP